MLNLEGKWARALPGGIRTGDTLRAEKPSIFIDGTSAHRADPGQNLVWSRKTEGSIEFVLILEKANCKLYALPVLSHAVILRMTAVYEWISRVKRKTESHCELLKNAKPKRGRSKIKTIWRKAPETNLTTLVALKPIATNVLTIFLKQHKQELLGIHTPIYEWPKNCGKSM